MLKQIPAVLWLALAIPVATAAEPKPITEASTVLAIYNEDWGLAAADGPQLIFCLWDDGTLVWSDDQQHGGAPFRSAQLSPDTLTKTLEQFDDRGLFEVPKLKHANWGPDSSFTKIVIRGKDHQLEMESWHELFESGGKTIAASHGLTGLNGKKLLPALAQEPAEYLHYRMTWLEIRLAAANLIPKAGTPTAGTATMKAGKLSWYPAAERQ